MVVFLGSSNPPGPDTQIWWLPILAHLFLFGVLGFQVSVSVLLIARSKRLRLNLAIVVVVGSFWGVFTELYQTTVPGRGAAVDDLLIDIVGSALGGLIAGAVRLWVSLNMAGTTEA